jgi:hypothetical protein
MKPYDEENDDEAEYDLDRFLYEVNQDREPEPEYDETELSEMYARFEALFS